MKRVLFLALALVSIIAEGRVQTGSAHVRGAVRDDVGDPISGVTLMLMKATDTAVARVSTLSTSRISTART